MNALRLTCLVAACVAAVGCETTTTGASTSGAPRGDTAYGVTNTAPPTVAAAPRSTAPRPPATAAATGTTGATGSTTAAAGTGTTGTAAGDPSTTTAAGTTATGTLQLSGAQQVPPIMGSGTGSGSIIVGADGTVSGSVRTSGVEGTAAHIHVGSPGTNGPVIIPLTKEADNTWTVPQGAKLSEEQMRRYKAGDLYVNVHTAANPNGEVRAQIKP